MEKRMKIIKGDDEDSVGIKMSSKEYALQKQDEYSHLRNEREKATFAMTMKMNPEALTNIRKEFFARKDVVSLDEFMYIIQKHLVSRGGEDRFVMETKEQREFGTSMYELFKDIDVNGDRLLEWQEFTSFTVEKANLLNKRAKLASIAHYHDSSNDLDLTARCRRRHDISRFVNIPALGQFAMLEDHKSSIHIFNSRLGKQIAEIKTDSAPIAVENMNVGDRQYLVTSGADMTLSTYSLDSMNHKRPYQLHSTWATPGVQMALAYGKELRMLYSGATNGNIYSWNWQNRSLVSTITGHTDIVMNLVVLQKLDNIASASLDKTLGIWDSHTNEQILRLSGHKKGVFDLAYSPNYRLLFSCGFEHDACVWSPFVNSMVFRLKGHHASLVGVHAVEDSPEVITSDTSGVFKLWDIRNFQCVQTFSANLTGQDTKDSSKLTCFFHTKFPSSNVLQKEDDSRIYAASKLLFSFDQARVVHEATTDYSNIFWIAWNEINGIIITASERNVIVWDALIGSKTFTHTNICGEEISACCLDDRKRKIVIGDVTGKIGVYNYSSGALMKTVHQQNPSTVVALEYYNKSKSFVAGYANGVMCIFDENVLEECPMIRVFEHFNRHPELLNLRFNPFNHSVATCGSSSEMARLWDYDSGKCDTELHLGASSGAHIVHLAQLLPYPVVATSDSLGNIVLWGARGIRWQGLRLSGFLNMTPGYCDYEPRTRKADEDEEEAPRRAIPPNSEEEDEVAPISQLPRTASFAGLFAHDSTVMPAVVTQPSITPSVSRGGTAMSTASNNTNTDERMTHTRQRGLRSSFNPLCEANFIDPVTKQLSMNEASKLHEEAAAKWGKVAPAQYLCFDAERSLLFAGDDVGNLRCFDLTDVFDDLRAGNLNIEASNHRISGLCRRKRRNLQSALPPAIEHHDDEFDATAAHYLLGEPGNHMGYLGAKFKWSILAHNDRIINCTAVTHHGILTSAADRLVKMWTFDGLPLGTLLQSVPVGKRSRSWELVFDVNEIITRENQELDDIIEKVQKVANDPQKANIATMDFSGMQLGAESAEFSRSVLRQRIEKTTKILGLDFPHKNPIDVHTNGHGHGPMSPHRQSPHSPTYNERKFTQQLRDDLTLGEQSSISSAAGKSIVEALKEVKSTDSAVDYEKKTKQMSLIQQKRKANKLMSISKAYEAKTGVKVKSSSGKDGVAPWQQDDRSSTGSGAGGGLAGGSLSQGDNVHDLDKFLTTTSAEEIINPRDESTVNNDLYSLSSIVELQQIQAKEEKILAQRAKSKIAQSIEEAQYRGARTQSMMQSCKRFSSYSALEQAIKAPSHRDSITTARPEELAEIRAYREKKHQKLFQLVAGNKLETKSFSASSLLLTSKQNSVESITQNDSIASSKD